MNLYIILAIIPFFLLFYLIIFRRMHAYKAMPIVWLVTIIMLLLFWKNTLITLGGSLMKSVLITLEILLIIFFAIVMLEIYKEKRKLSLIHEVLSGISPDLRIQTLIVGFLLTALIEGVAGFGTPAIVVAPLLVSLGFTPILSVIISLVSESSPVSFGAAGTPILIGLGNGGVEINNLL